MTTKKRPRGRPRLAPEKGERYSLGLRVSEEMRQHLVAASKASGRSLSQEAELRLEIALRDERSFRDNLDYVAGREGSAVLQLFAYIMHEQGPWIEDPAAFATIRGCINSILDKLEPEGVVPTSGAVAEGKVLQLLGQLLAEGLQHPVWFKWMLELRERLPEPAVARVKQRLVRGRS